MRAFLASSFGTALSRLLGAARDVTIANVLGAGSGSDAFWIAFTVPNVFRRFVADEGLTGALVPAVAKAESKEGTGAAKGLANQTFTALILANLVLCGLGIWKADLLVRAFAYGFLSEPDKFELTVTLTRWLFPFLFFVSLVSMLEALLNHRGHFFVPKLAPGVVSAGIVASALLLSDRMERPEYALVVGVLAGGLLHFALVAVAALIRWGKIGLSFSFSSPRFKGLMAEMGKVLLIGILAQVNIIVLRQLASLLGDGAVTRYWYANRLVDLAQGIVAVGVSSALLPEASKSAAGNDQQGLKHGLGYSIELAGFLLLPAAAVTAAFAEPLSSVLFRHGRYTAQDVRWTASTLSLLSPFLLAVAGINILKKVFFAMDDRNTLLAVGGIGVAVTAGLGWWLISGYNILGLAAALSVSTCLQLCAYLWLLHRKLDRGLDGLGVVTPLVRMALACIPGTAWLYFLSGLGDWAEGCSSIENPAIVTSGLLGFGILYLVVGWLLGIRQSRELLARMRRSSS